MSKESWGFYPIELPSEWFLTGVLVGALIMLVVMFFVIYFAVIRDDKEGRRKRKVLKHMRKFHPEQ